MIIFLPPEDDWIQFSHTGRTCLKLPVYVVHASLEVLTIKVQLKSEAQELTGDGGRGKRTFFVDFPCTHIHVGTGPSPRG